MECIWSEIIRVISKSDERVVRVRFEITKSYEDKAFSVASPKQWNDLPLDIKLSGSVDVFKSRLKTYLFRLSIDFLF